MLTVLCGFPVGARPAEGPIPLQPVDPIQALSVQRSAALLSGGSPTRRHAVRVVIYGQSISQQDWAWNLLRELPGRFRNAEVRGNLQAITSFNADSLIQTAEADIYPLLPDLIIFHCYGPYLPGHAWEQILREFRTRTTADILLMGNHPVAEWELTEPVDPAVIDFDAFPATHGQAWVNYIRIPEVSRELGLCHPDNRSVWKRYLRENGMQPKELLVDHIHFNLRGSELLNAILIPYLQAPRLSPPLDPFNNARVQTHPVGAGWMWREGRLRLPFTGNRVDLIAAAGAGGPCRVTIDGVPPSQWPSGSGHARASGWTGEVYYRPALLQVGAQVPLVSETWGLTITEVDPVERRRFKFAVEGSVTGPDGSGISTEPFVSRSRRVVIATNHWNFLVFPTNSQVGTRITWVAQVRSVDRYEPRPLRGPTVETWVNLINDLPDGPHVLELVADAPSNPPPLAAVRIYHPAGGMPGTESAPSGGFTLRYLRHQGQVLTAWPAALTTAIPLYSPVPNGAWSLDRRVPAESWGFKVLLTPLQEPTGFFRLEFPR